MWHQPDFVLPNPSGHAEVSLGNVMGKPTGIQRSTRTLTRGPTNTHTHMGIPFKMSLCSSKTVKN